MQPISPCGRSDFHQDESLGTRCSVTNSYMLHEDILTGFFIFVQENTDLLPDALPINKMAFWLSVLTLSGNTQICVARGSVSWGSRDNDAAGELQLWCHERDNNYCLYASRTTGDDMAVCKVIDVLLFTSKSALTKSKRY